MVGTMWMADDHHDSKMVVVLSLTTVIAGMVVAAE